MDDDMMKPGVIEDLIVPLIMAGCLAAFIQMVFRLEKEKKNGDKIED